MIQLTQTFSSVSFLTNTFDLVLLSLKEEQYLNTITNTKAKYHSSFGEGRVQIVWMWQTRPLKVLSFEILVCLDLKMGKTASNFLSSIKKIMRYCISKVYYSGPQI